MTDFEGPRLDYVSGTLDEASAGSDPVALFRSWLDDAEASDMVEPTVMTLATVDAHGNPHARLVLLRRVDERGIAVFTNLRSAKAAELAARPRAALVFNWIRIDRQVRVEGPVAFIDDDEADEYYDGRDRGRQIGAWASPQSQVIASRDELDDRVRATEDRFAGRDVPRPEFWGGYRIGWERVEFWQGRPSRLHDRIVFRRGTDGWLRERLAP